MIKPKRVRAPSINPLEVLAMKQTVGTDDADAIELAILVHLDAAKRGQCVNAGANHLTEQLIIASYLAASLKAPRFHAQVTKAYDSLKKASDRPTKLLDLTTGEYQDLRAAIRTYALALPKIEVGMMAQAYVAANRALQ